MRNIPHAWFKSFVSLLGPFNFSLKTYYGKFAGKIQFDTHLSLIACDSVQEYNQ